MPTLFSDNGEVSSQAVPDLERLFEKHMQSLIGETISMM
jgi:hypothetical protein